MLFSFHYERKQLNSNKVLDFSIVGHEILSNKTKFCIQISHFLLFFYTLNQSNNIIFGNLSIIVLIYIFTHVFLNFVVYNELGSYLKFVGGVKEHIHERQSHFINVIIRNDKRITCDTY